jgi:hypothetical protein
MDIGREKRQQDHHVPGKTPAGNGVAVSRCADGPDLAEAGGGNRGSRKDSVG